MHLLLLVQRMIYFWFKSNILQTWIFFWKASSCYEECDGDSQSSRIQSRPLPPPPAPTRSLRRGAQKRTPSPTSPGEIISSSKMLPIFLSLLTIKLTGFLIRSSSSHSQVEQVKFHIFCLFLGFMNCFRSLGLRPEIR